MVAILIFFGVIFLVLIFFMRQFMKSHVTDAVGHLQRMNGELMKQQSELKQKIAEAEKEYQSKKHALEKEITEREAQMRKDAAASIEQAREQANKEKERLINEAIETRDNMRQEVMKEMEGKAIQYSHEVMDEFLIDERREQMHKMLTQEVIDGIKDIDFSQFQVEGNTAELVTAVTLDPKLKAQIKKAIEEKVKREIELKEVQKNELIGGVILSFGPFVIDGSLKNHLKEATARLRRETARRYQASN